MDKKLLSLLVWTLMVSSCAVKSEKAIECTDPRPEMCTMQYQPVCATRDTGIRCVTTPCDATELKTYSNACVACRDTAVVSYEPGRCDEKP